MLPLLHFQKTKDIEQRPEKETQTVTETQNPKEDRIPPKRSQKTWVVVTQAAEESREELRVRELHLQDSPVELLVSRVDVFLSI